MSKQSQLHCHLQRTRQIEEPILRWTLSEITFVSPKLTKWPFVNQLWALNLSAPITTFYSQPLHIYHHILRREKLNFFGVLWFTVCCVCGSRSVVFVFHGLLCFQGEDGFPGVKGDFGVKGERVSWNMEGRHVQSSIYVNAWKRIKIGFDFPSIFL